MNKMTNPDGTTPGMMTSTFWLKMAAIVAGAFLVHSDHLDVTVYWAAVTAIVGIYSAIRWDTHRRADINNNSQGDNSHE